MFRNKNPSSNLGTQKNIPINRCFPNKSLAIALESIEIGWSTQSTATVFNR